MLEFCVISFMQIRHSKALLIRLRVMIPLVYSVAKWFFFLATSYKINRFSKNTPFIYDVFANLRSDSEHLAVLC